MRVELFSVPGCQACVGVLGALVALQAEREDLVVEQVDLSEHPERGREYGILSCPALAVNGRVEVLGSIGLRRLRRLLARIDQERHPEPPVATAADGSVRASGPGCCEMTP